jgi:hypothetical protein
VVKAMAEAGNPGLTFNRTDVIYGGRTLKDHWRLGTQNIVKQATLTEAEEKATIAALEKAVAADPKDKYAPSALARHRQLLPKIEANRKHGMSWCSSPTAMTSKAIPRSMPSMRRSSPNSSRLKVLA